MTSHGNIHKCTLCTSQQRQRVAVVFYKSGRLLTSHLDIPVNPVRLRLHRTNQLSIAFHWQSTGEFSVTILSADDETSHRTVCRTLRGAARLKDQICTQKAMDRALHSIVCKFLAFKHMFRWNRCVPQTWLGFDSPRISCSILEPECYQCVASAQYQTCQTVSYYIVNCSLFIRESNLIVTSIICRTTYYEYVTVT